MMWQVKLARPITRHASDTRFEPWLLSDISGMILRGGQYLQAHYPPRHQHAF
jgi:hypothetical protein